MQRRYTKTYLQLAIDALGRAEEIELIKADRTTDAYCIYRARGVLTRALLKSCGEFWLRLDQMVDSTDTPERLYYNPWYYVHDPLTRTLLKELRGKLKGDLEVNSFDATASGICRDAFL